MDAAGLPTDWNPCQRTGVTDEWVIRRAVAEDEDSVVPLWLMSLCWAQKARDLGFRRARERGHEDQVAWWALNHGIVTALVRTADVTVLCDPTRATHEPGLPAVIWGWSVTSGDVVYGCGVKNSMMAVGMGRDVARALLGDRLERPQVRCIELVDLDRLRLVPKCWEPDIQWWATMRHLSQLAYARRESATSIAAANHLLDPQREPWLPRSQRAA